MGVWVGVSQVPTMCTATYIADKRTIYSGRKEMLRLTEMEVTAECADTRMLRLREFGQTGRRSLTGEHVTAAIIKLVV